LEAIARELNNKETNTNGTSRRHNWRRPSRMKIREGFVAVLCTTIESTTDQGC